jgi:putative peptidoglycan lipid II flippase
VTPLKDSSAASGRHALLVAAGILLSRVVGLLRQTLFANLFGSGAAAGAFAVATRIPNMLQNLLGEGVLSASFIPVYASLRAEQKDAEADQTAGAVFGLLSLLVAALVALGVLAAPFLVGLIAPGLEGASFELTCTLVRIIFPGTGVLVLSAWCLGILNSHRRFFLSYAAPVMWNGAIIATLFAAKARGTEGETAIHWVAWATVAGGLLQFLVQVPSVLRLLGRFAPRPSWSLASVRAVLRGFAPSVAARGVVQISAFTDNAFVSLISERALAAISYAQVISLLPISLFGMSISAAELPAMAADGVRPEAERAALLRERLKAGLERMAFFVVPSAAAFICLGDVVAAVLYESGKFTPDDSRYLWYILLGSGVALFAQTSGRLYSSAFYALKDTRTPLVIAATRVSLGIVVGYFAVRVLPGRLGLPAHLGAVFITITTGMTAWLEMTLLRDRLTKRIGVLPSIRGRLVVLWAAAMLAGLLAVLVKYLATSYAGGVELAEWAGWVLPMPKLQVKVVGLALLAAFGAVYLGLAFLFKVPQATQLLRGVARRVRPSKS